MLFLYEGINKCIDANFVKDYNNTTMCCISKNSEDVTEVWRCIKMQLQVPCKVFTTVDQLCNHLELCSMMTIIADVVKQGGRAGAAWQLAENHVITNAMTLVQLHLKHAREEPEAAPPPITTLSTGARRFEEINLDEEKDALALQADISKRQQALAVLQTKPGSEDAEEEGEVEAAVAAEEELRVAVADTQAVTLPTNESMHHLLHAPPWGHCYKCYVKAVLEALDTLEVEQRAATARAKDRAEQKSKTLTEHFTSESKTNEVYLVLCSPWTLFTTPPPNDFNFEICLNVSQATGQPLRLGAAVDSASPIDIQNQKDLAKLTFCQSIFLEGIRECSFPTINQYCNPVILKLKGKGIFYKPATLRCCRTCPGPAGQCA
eukprot:2166256-Rhodomonas_salina.1